MMSVFVSIIVPVYNVEKYIKSCIDSLLSQTCKDFEIILVDDGSKDKSSEICDEYAASNDRIRVIHRQNTGQAGARNAGLLMAEGSHVMFVDADDRITPDALERLTAELEKDDDLLMFNIVGDNTDGPLLKAAGTAKITVLSDDDRKKLLADTYAPMREYYPLLHDQRISPCTKLYRKAFLDENDLRFPEDVKVHEDTPYAVSVFHAAKKIRYIDLDIYHYRFNPQSTTAGYRKDYVSEIRDLLDYMSAQRKELTDDGITEEFFYDRVAASLIQLLIRDLCHKSNKRSYDERKREYKELVKKEPYNRMTDHLKWWNTAYPVKKRIAAGLLKTGNFFLMDKVFSNMRLRS